MTQFNSVVAVFLTAAALSGGSAVADHLQDLQQHAVAKGDSEAVHWGTDKSRYSTWSAHSNRLIPVYTFGTKGRGGGVDLNCYSGKNSIYRSQDRLHRLYRGPADDSANAEAEYLDQTNIFDIQAAALKAGKKHIFLVVFDGMDWDTTRAASIWNLQRVAYDSGRGEGTYFQDFTADGTSEFGWMVTSPASEEVQTDVNAQRVFKSNNALVGGYNAERGGYQPWDRTSESEYLIAGPKNAERRHAYADSASSATSMNSGIKTFNAAINVDPSGTKVATIAHRAQLQKYRIGVVTSVPISHATPAATYAHNVSREDYQDLARDLVGLPSISHPEQPLPGVDVLIGAGHGVEVDRNKDQGENFVPGNDYIAMADLNQISVAEGGKYVVSVRTPGCEGGQHLQAAAVRAANGGHRLLGFYGVGGDQKYVSGHLPFASANGDFKPASGLDGKRIEYSAADLLENPSLAEMTQAALTVLSSNGNDPFWLMVEEGDVDWANHSNNLDASIGAVKSGEDAIKVIAQWVEENSNWDESLMIVTGDHGHFLHLDRPELLIGATSKGSKQ